MKYYSFLLKINEMWLSLLERYVRDVEVAGSNPVISTKKKGYPPGYPFFFVYMLGDEESVLRYRNLRHPPSRRKTEIQVLSSLCRFTPSVFPSGIHLPREGGFWVGSRRGPLPYGEEDDEEDYED